MENYLVTLDKTPWKPEYTPKEIMRLREAFGARNYINSGFAGLTLKPQDHILIWVADDFEDNTSILPHLMDSVSCGVTNQTYNEICSLEVDDRFCACTLQTQLQAYFGEEVRDKVDVLDWGDTSEEFPESMNTANAYFSVNELETFFTSEKHHARKNLSRLEMPLLRIISQDTGRYLASLINPVDYTHYESILVEKLREKLDCSILQFCCVETKDIFAAAKSSTSAFLGKAFAIIKITWLMLKAHNRIVFVREDKASCGAKARLFCFLELALHARGGAR